MAAKQCQFHGNQGLGSLKLRITLFPCPLHPCCPKPCCTVLGQARDTALGDPSLPSYRKQKKPFYLSLFKKERKYFICVFCTWAMQHPVEQHISHSLCVFFLPGVQHLWTWGVMSSKPLKMYEIAFSHCNLTPVRPGAQNPPGMGASC